MNGFEANPEELIAKGNRINIISNNYFDEKSKIYSGSSFGSWIFKETCCATFTFEIPSIFAA